MPINQEDQISRIVYSEELHEIVGQAPRGVARWGTVVMLILLATTAGISFLVQYADVVYAPVTVIAGNAPKSVMAKVDGKLVRLFVRENAPVMKGDVLAFMESTAIHEEVIQLSDELDSTLQLISKGSWEGLQRFRTSEYGHLGELQAAYQTFMQSFIQLQSYLQKGLYVRKKAMIQQDMLNNEALRIRLEAQLTVHEKDLKIAREDFAVKELLYKEKVLAFLEYKQEESKLLNKQLPLENIRAALISNKVSSSVKEQELVQLEQQFTDHKNGFVQALHSLINEVRNWEAKYLLVAPVSGSVMFSVMVHENQDVKSGQELCYVAPANGAYYGEMHLPQENFGKIRLGQSVLIKLASYPYQEYGRLTGHITFISEIPNSDKRYTATVTLDRGLLTDYGRKLEFRNNLMADAEVITKKRPLAYKFLYTLRYIWDKH